MAKNYAREFQAQLDALADAQRAHNALGHPATCACDECERMAQRWDQLLSNPPCPVCNGVGCLRCNDTGVA